MMLTKIQAAAEKEYIEQILVFGDMISEAEIVAFVKQKYPGNYKVFVTDNLRVSLEFDSQEDAVIFFLKY